MLVLLFLNCMLLLLTSTLVVGCWWQVASKKTENPNSKFSKEFIGNILVESVMTWTFSTNACFFELLKQLYDE